MMLCCFFSAKTTPSHLLSIQSLNICLNFIWVVINLVKDICFEKYLIIILKFDLERIFEDHENIVEAMSNWSRDSENQIIFTEKDVKYDLFLRPEVN